ncbi:MAG: thiamine phosphate synthase [Pseudomonadota bacterium]
MGLSPRALRLYLVTDPDLCAERGLVDTVRCAVAGGATMVQLRDKTAETRTRIAQANALKGALKGTGVPVLINDDVEAAILSDADGAHVGQGDISAVEARSRLGPSAILGLSCETEEHVVSADPSIVDYLGIGTVFATATKSDHGTAIGLDGVERLCARTTLPCVAIGGLKAEHNSGVLAAGADGLAVISAICGAPDPTAAARAFYQETELA